MLTAQQNKRRNRHMTNQLIISSDEEDKDVANAKVNGNDTLTIEASIELVEQELYEREQQEDGDQVQTLLQL